jgi:hypothetical protein
VYTKYKRNTNEAWMWFDVAGPDPIFVAKAALCGTRVVQTHEVGNSRRMPRDDDRQ